MKNTKKTFLELSKQLKPLEDSFEGQLKGGFASFSTDVNVFGCGKTNTNCQGGNCVAGCGGSDEIA